MRYGYDYIVGLSCFPEESHDRILEIEQHKAAEQIGLKLLEDFPPIKREYYFNDLSAPQHKFSVRIFVMSEEKMRELFSLAKRMEDKRLLNILETC